MQNAQHRYTENRSPRAVGFPYPSFTPEEAQSSLESGHRRFPVTPRYGLASRSGSAPASRTKSHRSSSKKVGSGGKACVRPFDMSPSGELRRRLHPNMHAAGTQRTRNMVEENLRMCVDVDFGLQKVLSYTEKLQHMQKELRAALIAQLNSMDEESVGVEEKERTSSSNINSSDSNSDHGGSSSGVNSGGDGHDAEEYSGVQLEVASESDTF
ncbi:MAG: hypothetical protein Q9200_003419 [Gallowayella weberi]